MDNNVLMKFISFWAFMLGVAVFGRLLGFLDNSKQSALILLAAALVFVVWDLGRSKAKRRREEREYEEQQMKMASRKGSGKKNKR